jgi:hypothetical protein
VDRDVADEQVDALEQRVQRLLAVTEPDPAAEAGHLAGIEYAVLEALHRGRERDGELADDRGHPVLANAASFAGLLGRAGAPRAAERAGRFVGDLVSDRADAWRARTESTLDRADPEACFHALAEARELDLEALARGAAGPPLAAYLPGLRDALLEAVEARPPAAERRAAWVVELRDRADVVLTSIDDVAPERAGALLARVMKDLAWHAKHVEPKGSLHRRLRQRVRRLHAERQERDLQAKLDKRFGARNAARFERLIFWLIIFVLAILGYEAVAEPPWSTVRWLIIADTAACVIFLWEFFVKLWMVRGGRLFWFYRHFLVDFLPSIPVGAFLLHGPDPVRAGRAIRLVRVSRLARNIRIMRPLIRLVRAFGFLSRGIDRIARKYGALINRNIVLFPTREERRRLGRPRQDVATRLRALQAQVQERWELVLAAAPREAREDLAAGRLDGLERARAQGLLHRELAADGTMPRRPDLAAGDVLRALGRLSAPQLEGEMGQDFVARVSRAVRIFAFPPLRWLPFVRKYVPRVTPAMSDADVVVAAAHKSSAELRRHHDRYFWFADLYGTITPAQFVDRVGHTMVKAAKRPAVRLLLFGAAYLIVIWLLPQSGIESALRKIVGPVLQVLGGICLAILAVGWWLLRIAGQATDFFSQAARAQYLELSESIKNRDIERHAAVLERRVFRPERLVHGERHGNARERFLVGVDKWLREAQPGRAVSEGFDPVERAVLLYRDSLDGAILVDNDTRTTAQLLGDPALRNLRIQAERITPADRRALQKLDLQRGRSFLRGPYLWFSLVCQAIEHGSARLIVDYNRHALPLDQLATASDEERQAYEAWLASERVADIPSRQLTYATTDFTALHFLDDDEQRDRDVALRFGDRILERLRRDRRHLIRRTFGTYPLHQRPHEERVLNAYRIYQRWLAGGRALLFPLRLVTGAVRFAWRFVTWVARCVGEIRRPRFEVDVRAVEGADFDTARRKINRMRAPVAFAALRIRARFDPEYLGILLPGVDASGVEGATVEQDLRFLDAEPDVERELAAEQVRAGRDMVRLGRLIRDGLWERVGRRLGLPAERFGREHLRAAAACYLSDMQEVRRHLSAREILDGVFERVADGDLPPRVWLPRPRLRRHFVRYWERHGSGRRAARRAAWRAVVHDVEGARCALIAWARHGDGARAEGERILAELLRHPQRLTEQLVTLRAVQTMSLIDVLNYRELVFRVGGYAASGDDPGHAFELA